MWPKELAINVRVDIALVYEIFCLDELAVMPLDMKVRANT